MKEDKAAILLDDEVEDDQCPMADTLQERLREFCATIVEKLRCRKADTENGGENNDNKDLTSSPRRLLEIRDAAVEEEPTSWVDSLARLVISVPPPVVIDNFSDQRRGTENFK